MGGFCVMGKMVAFKDLSATLQKRLIELRAQGSTLKGSSNGEKEATLFFHRKKPKTTNQWRNQRYFAMIRIDAARKKLGLAPIHFT